MLASLFSKDKIFLHYFKLDFTILIDLLTLKKYNILGGVIGLMLELKIQDGEQIISLHQLFSLSNLKFLINLWEVTTVQSHLNSKYDTILRINQIRDQSYSTIFLSNVLSRVVSPYYFALKLSNNIFMGMFLFCIIIFQFSDVFKKVLLPFLKLGRLTLF